MKFSNFFKVSTNLNDNGKQSDAATELRQQWGDTRLLMYTTVVTQSTNPCIIYY